MELEKGYGKMSEDNCPICGKELKTWYCCCGGGEYLGCSDITCNYKKEK